VIEESSSTPEEMQKNMGVVDECGNPSYTYNVKENSYLLKSLSHKQHLQMRVQPLQIFTIAARKKHQS
jgi:hypothetical protein